MLRRALPLLVVAAAQIAIVLIATSGQPEPATRAERRAVRADVGGPFPLELRSPQVMAGSSARVLVALRRPSLAELDAKAPQSPLRQRAYVRSLNHEARALISALEAKGVAIGRPILFARIWSGFAATIATDELPAVQALGLRVEPVSRFYPAQGAAKDAPAVRPLPTTASAPGSVAVLDAFPGRKAASRGRSSSAPARLAADYVARGSGGHPSAGERAGERIAAVVHDELPQAHIARYRVAGSQALENGKFEVFGTTDQLLAGLERVVDPDQNGDAADAVRVAVTGLSAPYSGFANTPAAQAVDGAEELGTLVVAAAGNGGDPEGPFGSIGAPGAAAGALTVGALDGSGEPATASSTGPTYELGPKPDLAIGGGAKTAGGTAWGTAIAAARVAGVATALRAERPKLTAAEAAAALVGTAAPRGAPYQAGGGDPLLQAARVTPIVAQPAQVILRPGETAGVRIEALAGAPRVTAPTADGVTLRLAGRRGHQTLFVTAQKEASGRIDLGPIAIPYEVVAGKPPSPALGRPEVVGHGGEPNGVRFVAGSIERQDKGTSVVPVGNLILTLTGPTRRVLTPPGGARDLLPGEYAYTLTDAIRSQLAPGRYRFILRAKGTAGGPTVIRSSHPFKVS